MDVAGIARVFDADVNVPIAQTLKSFGDALPNTRDILQTVRDTILALEVPAKALAGLCKDVLLMETRDAEWRALLSKLYDRLYELMRSVTDYTFADRLINWAHVYDPAASHTTLVSKTAWAHIRQVTLAILAAQVALRDLARATANYTPPSAAASAPPEQVVKQRRHRDAD